MDLTKNTSAFGLMDEADQNALMALPIAQVDVLGVTGWEQMWGRVFYEHLTYRQNPEPPKPVIETRSGECWVELEGDTAPTVWDSIGKDSVKSTYTQTTVNGKFARCVITAEGYTPTLTDEQARNVYKNVHGIEKPTAGELSLVHEFLDAFVKAGVM